MTSGFGHNDWVWVAALAAVLLIAYRFYRRVRRLIGRQRFAERRLWMRTVLLSALTIFAIVSLGLSRQAAISFESATAGFVVGAVIGVVALRFMQMGRDDEGLWYIPNLYLGIGLIGLLIARFVYKYVVIIPQLKRELAQTSAHGATSVTVPESPVFLAILFLVLGYYLVYYGGILLRGRRMLAGAALAAGDSDS